MKVYVASSWRNAHQPRVVIALRDAGHEVYDFRHPGEGERGFAWSDIDPNWQRWSVDDFRLGLRHDLARHAFRRDQEALEWCDACVLVLPSGMSAHLEAGWCAGRDKLVVVYAPEIREAELMYKLFDAGDSTPLHRGLDEVLSQIEAVGRRG